MSTVSGEFKINTSGLTDTLDNAQENFKKITDLITGDVKKYNTIHENVVTAFEEIPENEDPLDDDNFNTIVESLVAGDDALTLDATNNLKAFVLVQMGYDSDAEFSELSEVDAEQFLESLTQIIIAYSGDNSSFSLEEFENMLTGNGFTGEAKEDAESDDEKS